MGFTARADLLKMKHFKMFNSITVPSSAWSASTAFADYPYQADITLEGISQSWGVNIVFNPVHADLLGGAFTQPQDANGKVRIYAKKNPAQDIIIVAALCFDKGEV